MEWTHAWIIRYEVEPSLIVEGDPGEAPGLRPGTHDDCTVIKP